MWQLRGFVLSFYISWIQTQILYECNFDISTKNCFIPEVNVSSHIGIPNRSIPSGPLADVTSSLKPTDNGEICQLPYRIDTYEWDMYFCNQGYCPTQSSDNSRCQTGQFGFVQLLDSESQSFQFNMESIAMHGINEQCLIYYYYMSDVSENVITLRKEESNGENEIIDSVTNSPFSGWIQRQIPLHIHSSSYKILFQVQKISGLSTSYVAFDEISINQGECHDRPLLDDVEADNVTSTTDQSTAPSATSFQSDSSSIETTDSSISDESSTVLTSLSEDTTSESTQTTGDSGSTTVSEETTEVSTLTSVSSETTELTSEPTDLSTETTIIESTIMTLSTSASMTSTETPPTEITTILSTSSPIETSSFELPTTEETTDFVTTISISSTIESSTTTIILTSSTAAISTESTNMTTDSDITGESTMITSTIPVTTTSDVNVVIDSYEKVVPYETSHIILMCAVIPTLWFTFFIVYFWARRSTDVIGGILHPLNNLSRDGKSWGSYELNDVSEA